MDGHTIIYHSFPYKCIQICTWNLANKEPDDTSRNWKTKIEKHCLIKQSFHSFVSKSWEGNMGGMTIYGCSFPLVLSKNSSNSKLKASASYHQDGYSWIKGIKLDEAWLQLLSLSSKVSLGNQPLTEPHHDSKHLPFCWMATLSQQTVTTRTMQTPALSSFSLFHFVWKTTRIWPSSNVAQMF